MEQPFSTSKVTVEYFDPHGVFKLLAPGLVPRLPLRNLHWQSHAGPLRSIETLHVELVSSAGDSDTLTASSQPPATKKRSDSSATNTTNTGGRDSTTADDGFQTQTLGGSSTPADTPSKAAATANRASNSTPITRRHQIPGLRRTPYLKVLLIRCDDNDSYKSSVRGEVRDWIKTQTPATSSKKSSSTSSDNHDAFDWLVIHVVIPNTAAASQPRKSDSAQGPDGKPASTASRWRPGSSSLLEKLRSDFNASGKNTVDHIAQIRIGVNDVPYDLLPRVVPAVPTGYTESDHESEMAWNELITKFRSLILSSFDQRVTQYEDDIKEKDAQRSLPGWNFCTFFILKEGLARGFESVGLVDDALVGYDELSVGLDTIVKEQAAGLSGATTNALPSYTEELKRIAIKAKASIDGAPDDDEEDEVVDMQSQQQDGTDRTDAFDDIPISSTKKPYRDLILANNVSVFDFRCYIFSRQIALLLRLGNAWSTREELLAKLKDQQESALRGVAPLAPPPKPNESEDEDLIMLSEICRRTLEFIPSVSQVMRKDVISSLVDMGTAKGDSNSPAPLDAAASEVVDNLVTSFAFSIAQQVLAQTSTKSLPIPPSTLASDQQEPKSTIPEPKTMMHPARHSSLSLRQSAPARRGTSPNALPGDSRLPSDPAPSSFAKAGLEELAAKRAELYVLSRNILKGCGQKRGWSDGWDSVPVVAESTMVDMVEISLDDNDESKTSTATTITPVISLCGITSRLLKTALDNNNDFYRLYETLTDKALRHQTVACHDHSVQSSMSDIAVLKFHLQDYESAASYFWRTTPFFGESGWSLLELSMLVMYSKCLKELQRNEEYVKVMLKLLTKAATAERTKHQHRSSLKIGAQAQVQYPDNEAIKGLLGDLLEQTGKIPNEVRMPLSGFISTVEIDGTPVYHDGKDSASVNLRITSLLVDNLHIEKAKMRVSSSTAAQREIWFELSEATTIRPGQNRLTLDTNTVVPGFFEIDMIDLGSNNMWLHYERPQGQAPGGATEVIKSPQVAFYQRAETLDVRMSASDHIQLDRDNMIDLDLNSGWNELTGVEIRVVPVTGGLRLRTSDAKCVDAAVDFAKAPESGILTFPSIPRDTIVKVRFPYSVEMDLTSVAIRVEVTYTTEHGTYSFAKRPHIPVALALGVNVQDVFKHQALFSRFTVSTGSQSPLRLYKSELLSSDVFESSFGVPPADPVVIFPRQPAGLLYKISRKPGVDIESASQKTMYLRLHYSVLHEEIEAKLSDSLTKSLEDTSLWQYSRLIISTIASRFLFDLSAVDQERAALVGFVPTSSIAGVQWDRVFGSTTPNVASEIASFLAQWQTSNPRLHLPTGHRPAEQQKTILIPVDIPSITIVHTADIRLQSPSDSSQLPAPDESLSPIGNGNPEFYTTSQMLPAILHLRWTRIWDTATAPSRQADLEFSYEVASSQDTWLLGGRRRGHFVIPAPTTPADGGNPSAVDGLSTTVGSSSTPLTEAEIPLLLIPQREGWLPYPSVDIREVVNNPSNQDVAGAGPAGLGIAADGSTGSHAFETDFRNTGESVRIVPDRQQVTLSLDASGPGGGPLVLGIEPGVRGVAARA